VAKILEGTGACAHTQIGTPFYLSPEICENKPYDAKSDMWSLGCVLYECLALRPPFAAKDMMGMVRAIMHSHAKPVSNVYSKDMRNLVAALLVKDPSKRLDVRGVLKLPFVRKAAEEMLGAAQAQSKQASRPSTSVPSTAAPTERKGTPASERQRTPPSERQRTPPKVQPANVEKARVLDCGGPKKERDYRVYKMAPKTKDEDAAAKIQAMMRRSFRKNEEKKATQEQAPSRPRSRAKSRPGSRPAQSRAQKPDPRTRKEEDAASKIQSMFRESLKKKAVARNKALVADRIKDRRKSAGGYSDVSTPSYAGLPSQRDTRYDERKANYNRVYGR